MMRSLLCVAVLLSVSCGESLSPVGPQPGGADGGGVSNERLPDGGFVQPRARFEDYIRKDRYPQLVLEIDSVPGFEPRASTEAAVVAQLEALLDKPLGVEAVRDQPIASRGADHAWTFAELDALAKQSFDLQIDPQAIKMHVLFVDGHWSEDSSNGKVLGVAWAHTHLVMFKKTIEDACRAGLTGVLAERLCENAEHGVWVHEVGHLLGLVDNGLPMVQPHADPDHVAHDISSDCVMYWAYDTGTLVDDLRSRLLGGNEAKLELDAACKADVAAVRDR